MGDLKVGEAFQDRVFIKSNVFGVGATGLTPTCFFIDESGNRTGVATTEMSNGWYYVSFTPDVLGTWCVEWKVVGNYTIYFPYKEFKVGGGRTEDNYDILSHGTYGNAAIETLIDDVENMLKAAPSTDSILFKAGGDTCPAGVSIWNALGDGTVDINDLDTDLNTIIAELANGTYGLSALETLIDEVETLLKDGTYGLSALETLIDDLENMLKASPSVDSILFKSGGATCPANKSIWNALGDGTETINDIMDDIGTAITDIGTHDTDIKALLATVQTDLDNPDQYKADVAALALEATLDTHDTDIKALLANVALEASLATHDTDIKALLATVQADLDNPDQYKADVAALALEATLDTHDTDIKALLATIEAYVDCLPADFSAQVQSDVDAKLIAHNLDHFIQTTSTVNGATGTVNFFDTNLAEATDDHYNGLIILFTSGVLAAQASIIVDYDGTTKEITVDPAFTEAPSDTDTFVILGISLGSLRTGSKGLEQLYDLVDQLFNLGRVGDTITTDGNEQTIFIIDNPDFPFKPIKLLLDTTNHGAGETISVRQYLRLKEGGDYIEFMTTELAAAQSPIGVNFDLFPNTFGIKLTIEKTAGANVAYDYEVYMEER